jgi:hypothetical protein
MYDPSQPLAPPPPAGATAPAKRQASIQNLLEAQLEIAGDLQALIRDQKSSLSARDFKDLATSASNLIALAHRTDETLRTVQTYKSFVDVVLEFLRQRSDSLGEDLLAELREVAKGLRAEQAVEDATSQ